MNQSISITRKQALPILTRSFPEYTGRKIKIEFTETVILNATYWDGGTRSSYAAVLADGSHKRLRSFAPWDNPAEGKKITLSVDVLIIEHSIFCGKDCGIRIYAHPTHLPKWIAKGLQ